MTNFIKNVKSASALMRELFAKTPLQKNEFLSHKYSADVFLKREDLSPVRSYKIRGAFNSVNRIFLISQMLNILYVLLREIMLKALLLYADISTLRVISLCQ